MIGTARILRSRALVYAAAAIGVVAFAASAVAASAALTVTITSGPSGTTSDTSAVFDFSANARDASFTCSLDGAAATACSSPRTYRALAVGAHVFDVTASSGRERARASRSWTVSSQGPPPPPPPPPTLPCGQSLGQTKICFDDLPPGTVVGTQYSSLDVVFGVTPTGPNTVVKPFIAANPQAHSDGQILKVNGCGGEFCNDTIHGRFWHAHKYVRVWAGAGTMTKLTAYDGNGYSIGSATKLAGSAVATELQVSSSTAQIVYFTISEDAADCCQYANLALDDLTYDTPDPNAKPDFGLAWSATWGDNKLAVAAGGSSSTTIFITRLNGSSGPIGFAASGLPAGVTASFSPLNASTGTTSVLLKVKASSTAVTGGPPIPITVVGHPWNSFAGSTDRTLQVPLLLILGNFDARVTGIDVTQGIQSQVTPYYSGSNLSPAMCKNFPSLRWTNEDPPTLSYDATQPEVVQGLGGSTTVEVPFYVPLVADRRTVVRAYADLAYPSTGSLSGVKMLLYGYAESPNALQVGKPLPGSPLSAEVSPAKLIPGDIWTNCVARANPNAYTFTLPASWTEGRIKLKAKIFPEDVVYMQDGECGSPACTPNNAQTLAHVLFEPMPTVTVTPVLMWFSGALSAAEPGAVFADARYFSPSPLVWAGGSDNSYAALIDIQDIESDGSLNTNKLRCNALLDRLESNFLWSPGAPAPAHGDMTVGVFTAAAGCAGVSESGVTLPASGEAWSVVNATRPRKSVAHELFHGFGRVHASKGCNGGSNGQIGEPWPPDQQGDIHGIGLDTRFGSGPGSAPYAPIVPAALLAGNFSVGQQNRWFDFMSYCASEGNSWISDEGWRETVSGLTNWAQDSGLLRLKARRLERAPETGSTVRVSAVADGSHVQILRVQPGGGAVFGSPTDYRLVVRDGAGALVGEAALRGRLVGMHGEPPALLLAGLALADRAATIEIVHNGVVVAQRARSVHPPTVEVREPRAGAHVGRGRTVVVQWKASDADGDKLDATVDYSLDGGSSWRTIFSGRRPGRVALPSTFFAGSRDARVRVRINDGWNTAEAASASFVAVGRAPAVSISAPAPRQRARHDTALNLAGAAYDDRGQAIAASRLFWFDGHRRIGGGLHAVAFRPAPGWHTIRLVARDGRGRTGRASVRIRVLAVAPRLLDLRAPASVGRRATRLGFAVATTIPATLTVSGRRYSVGRTLRRVHIPILPGRGIVRVPLLLAADGKVTRTLLVLARHPSAQKTSIRSLAETAASAPGRAACTPGPRTIGGKMVVFFCGPAKATVRFAGKTIRYRNGECTKSGGMFTVNIGATVPGAQKQKYPYFGLTVEGTRSGTYARQNLGFAYAGRVYAIGQHTIVLGPGLRSGTFTGKSFPGLRPVSGSFIC